MSSVLWMNKINPFPLDAPWSFFKTNIQSYRNWLNVFHINRNRQPSSSQVELSFKISFYHAAAFTYCMSIITFCQNHPLLKNREGRRFCKYINVWTTQVSYWRPHISPKSTTSAIAITQIMAFNLRNNIWRSKNQKGCDVLCKIELHIWNKALFFLLPQSLQQYIIE